MASEAGAALLRQQEGAALRLFSIRNIKDFSSAFGGKADIVSIGDLCPLLTQSGHCEHGSLMSAYDPKRPFGTGSHSSLSIGNSMLE